MLRFKRGTEFKRTEIGEMPKEDIQRNLYKAKDQGHVLTVDGENISLDF